MGTYLNEKNEYVLDAFLADGGKYELNIEPSEIFFEGLDALKEKQSVKDIFTNFLLDTDGIDVTKFQDEYDKPITHSLEAKDSSEAEMNRDILKNFYSGLKDADKYLRFLFITGIAKFTTCSERSRTEVSIFSELNHLIDIILDRRFATLCGYTQAELLHYFPQGIQRLADENGLTKDECLAKVKDWYNGFSWDGKNFVYNPFSTLLLLNSTQFENYWFASGTPTFLVKMLNADFQYKLEKMNISVASFDLFDLKKLDVKAILLQTGYLTIKEQKEDILVVDFPNKEVRKSFNEMLIADYVNTFPGDAAITIYDIKEAFFANDLPQVMRIIQALFADVPYHLYEKKDAQGNIKEVGENFFHAIIYLIFNTLGVKIASEVAVNMGRIDVVVKTKEHIYIFEFNTSTTLSTRKNQKPLTAINQMKKKNHAEKYALHNKTIHLIGVSFSLEKRNLAKWKEVVVDR